MPNGTGMVTIADLPPVQLELGSQGLTIGFPGPSGSVSSVGTVTIPRAGPGPIDLNFSTGAVVSFQGTTVASVTFPPEQSGNPPVQLPVPEQGIGLIDMPQGGHLAVTIPQGVTREKLKVTVKAGVGTRLFTEAAAM
jgi:hypothetical protein